MDQIRDEKGLKNVIIIVMEILTHLIARIYATAEVKVGR